MSSGIVMILAAVIIGVGFWIIYHIGYKAGYEDGRTGMIDTVVDYLLRPKKVRETLHRYGDEDAVKTFDKVQVAIDKARGYTHE